MFSNVYPPRETKLHNKYDVLVVQSDGDWLHLYAKTLTKDSRFFAIHLPKIKDFTVWCYSSQNHNISMEPSRSTKFLADARVRKNIAGIVDVS